MSFKDIFGHSKPIGILQNAMRHDRLAHAYLFHGMEGIGKHTVALTFAKALNCRQKSFDACDSCISCIKTDHKNHPDIEIIEAAGQFIRIDAVKNLQERMKFRPMEGRKRIVILIEADKLNNAAANALLKTLEEPSHSNIIILITARPYQLPITILSRCQQIRFNPLQQEVVAELLRERFSLDEPQARLLAAASGGSMGKALELNREAFLVLKNEVLDWIANASLDSPLQRLSFIRFLNDDKRDILDKLDILKTFFRDALIFRETGKIEELMHQNRLELIAAFAGQRNTAEILTSIRAIDEAERLLAQNTNKSLTLEVMMFKLLF
jgi:DNA polymerase-3 subunit delta'